MVRVAIEAQFPFDRQILPGKRLVDLDQVDVVERQTGTPERQTRRRRRSHPHVSGLDADRRPRHQRGRAASDPRFATACSDASSTAAPPSTMPLALPAVTVPSFENAAGSFASPSSVVSGRR